MRREPEQGRPGASIPVARLEAGSGDAFEAEPLITFDKVDEKDFEGEQSVAKLEAIAADPARAGRVLYPL